MCHRAESLKEMDDSFSQIITSKTGPKREQKSERLTV